MTVEIQERHKKQLAVMRGFLEGRQFYVAAEALELVRGTENGTRKDGVTPKLHHQLSVARLVSTLLPHLLFPEETLAAAFLHDLLEDHGPHWTQEKLKTLGKVPSKGVNMTYVQEHYNERLPVDEASDRVVDETFAAYLWSSR